jgi:putative transposase
VSLDVIARVTDAILGDVQAWQEQPLDEVYPIVCLDGIVLKVRQGKQWTNRCAHFLLGLNLHGEKDVLGIWLSENEGAKFGAAVLTELKVRSCRARSPSTPRNSATAPPAAPR